MQCRLKCRTKVAGEGVRCDSGVGVDTRARAAQALRSEGGAAADDHHREHRPKAVLDRLVAALQAGIHDPGSSSG
jgi:hypothetical protein